jgi:hypothetical protein
MSIYKDNWFCNTSDCTFCLSKHHHHPIGREWAAATTQGLQIFSLDESMQFAPTDLDITITPQSVSAAIIRQEYGLAVNMSLHLGEKAVVKKVHIYMYIHMYICIHIYMYIYKYIHIIHICIHIYT